jgi:hypothetical protein
MPKRHESCCAVHNEPAYPNGPCDCKYREENERLWFPAPKSEPNLKASNLYPASPDTFEIKLSIEKAVAACMRDDR